MPPLSYVGANAREHRVLRITAVKAIGEIPVQASVDVLWDIAGLDTRERGDTRAVVALAQEIREKLMREHDFEDRSFMKRIGRSIRTQCDFLLSGPVD